MATIAINSPTGQLTAGNTYSFGVAATWEGYEFPKQYSYTITFEDSNGTVVKYYTDTVYPPDNFWDTSIIADTVVVPENAVRSTFWFELTYYVWGGTTYPFWVSDSTEYTVVYPDPVITRQPVLSLGGSSGAFVSMTWSAAEVSFADGATIYYQYFVGPSSSYSDSYHIGTTAELSHTMTEAEIISKCGNGFGASTNGSTCYLFVRAYWQKGSSTGGWSTPSGKAFTYYPTVNAPTNIQLTSAKGKYTSISWTNHTAGNNSQPQAVLRRFENSSWVNVAAGITDYSSGYTIPESTWKTLGKGTYTICISHEWYGRYANGASVTFQYAADNTVQVLSTDYVVYIYDSSHNQWVQCDPYVWQNNQWKLCSTS